MNEKTTLVFDKNVPLPKRVGQQRKYPFDEMQVGDSFLMTGPDAWKIGTAARAYAHIHGWKVTIRKTPEGLRCWRIE
jgi:hypothetical protein